MGPVSLRFIFTNFVCVFANCTNASGRVGLGMVEDKAMVCYGQKRSVPTYMP